MTQVSLYLIFSSLGVGAVLVVALYLLLPGLSALLRTRASQHWPSVQGVIIGAEVERHEYNQSISRTRRTRISYYPRVVYRYTVTGQTYNSERIYFGARVGGSTENAESNLSQYPPGNAVEVFYDPSNPSNAVLERRPSWTPIYAGLGMLGLALALGVLLFAIR